jgi:nucleotide-binding universal stress UspA family protein
MRVLLGYDGSDFATAALADLHRAGLPASVEMIVLNAVDMFVGPASPAAAADQWQARVDEALAGARAVADRGAARLRSEFPSWTISAEAVADSPGWAIIKRAEGLGGQPWRADLIVVGAAGHSAIGRIVFGSVAHTVLTSARCSTRIGRSARTARSGPIRLLVGVDGSQDARAAISAVAGRAWPAGTECRVLTVADVRMRTSLALCLPPGEPRLHAQRLADEAAETLRAAGLVTTAVAKDEEAARSLVHEAEAFGADCIFVGARGLGRVERFLLGSVSASVAMRASCTVEVVHPVG